jgi:hypothetical protein
LRISKKNLQTAKVSMHDLMVLNEKKEETAKDLEEEVDEE